MSFTCSQAFSALFADADGFYVGVALGLILGAAIATPVGISIGAARRRMLARTPPDEAYGDVTLVPNAETFR